MSGGRDGKMKVSARQEVIRAGLGEVHT